MRKRRDEFTWVELYKYDVNSYYDKYNNKLCEKLKENNIACFALLEYFSVKNKDRNFKCTIYVLKKDFEKSLEMLKE